MSKSKPADARVPGQPIFGSVWRVRNEFQYEGPPAWHPTPPHKTHPMVNLDEGAPDVVAAQPSVLAAPRSTKRQVNDPCCVYTNAGQSPGLDAGTILVRYAMPVLAEGFEGFCARVFMANLPPNVRRVLAAAKRAANIR